MEFTLPVSRSVPPTLFQEWSCDSPSQLEQPGPLKGQQLFRDRHAVHQNQRQRGALSYSHRNTGSYFSYALHTPLPDFSWMALGLELLAAILPPGSDLEMKATWGQEG